MKDQIQGITKQIVIAIYLLIIPLQIFAVPTDPEYVNQWGVDLVMTSPTDPTKTVWDIPNADGNGTRIYIVDTGVQRFAGASHDDHKAFLDDELVDIQFLTVTPSPFSFTYDSFDLSSVNYEEGDYFTGDTDGHGTGVYGIIAAPVDATGIAGMAPGAKVINVKAGDVADLGGNATNAEVEAIAGLDYVELNGISPYVVNVSRQQIFAETCVEVSSILSSANTIMVAGVGNAGINSLAIPANCSLSDRLISVGASNNTDTRWVNSNYSTDLDVFAPGVNIRSTSKFSAATYEYFTGTSFAAPIVSSAAAILMGCGIPAADIPDDPATVGIDESRDGVETLLTGSGPAIDFDGVPGGGSAPRINVYTALQNANNAPSALTMVGGAPLTANFTAGTDFMVDTLMAQVEVTDDLCDQPEFVKLSGSPELSVDADTGEITMMLGVHPSGTYTIEVGVVDFFGVPNAPADNLTYTVVVEPPVGPGSPVLDVALVLDNSGSMGWASAVAGQSRKDVLEDAAGAFVNALSMDTDINRLGLVQFSSTADQIPPAPAAETFPFGEITPANVADAVAAINSLTPGGSTSLVNGVTAGAALLADATPERSLLLFTDGLHNSPSVLNETTTPLLSTQLSAAIAAVDSSIRFYGIGFGDTLSINTDSLSQTASDNDGQFYHQLDAADMAKNFTDVAEDILDNAHVVDPEIIVKPGEIGELLVPVTYADKSVRFATFWTYANAANVLTSITTPSGDCTIRQEPKGNQFLQAKGKKYRLVNVELPFICNGRLEHGGKWEMEMSVVDRDGDSNTLATLASGVSVNTTALPQAERFVVSAYATSDVKLNASIIKSFGKKFWGFNPDLIFSAKLDGIAATDLQDVTYTAYITPPIDSGKLRSGDDELSPQEQAEQQRILQELIAAQKSIMLDMKPGESVDSASVLFDAKQTGVYQVRVVMEGVDKTGFALRRESRASIYYEYQSHDIWILCLLLILLLCLLIWLWRAKCSKH